MTLNNLYYPAGTASAVLLDKLHLADGQRALSDRLSSRLTVCASLLNDGSFLGWQMSVPKKGMIAVSLFGSDAVSIKDLHWIAENTGHVTSMQHKTAVRISEWELYELYLPAAENSGTASIIGFAGTATKPAPESEYPMHFGANFDAIAEAMRETGGILRVTVGAADTDAQQKCRETVCKSYRYAKPSAAEYLGTPVRERVLLLLPETPSLQLRTVLHEAVAEARLRHLGKMSSPETALIWDAPLKNAATLPDFAARILMPEPELHRSVVGFRVCREAAKKLPASHKNTKNSKAITLGRATDAAGRRRTITLGETDLKRHYQIIGQTGTGKSTLLATIILSAVRQGHGLTFFDPHGTTIDTVLRALPPQYADKVRLVRLGDAENPVPLNIWDSDSPMQEERNISDLCELFGDIFNPPGMDFVGPRYERWLSVFAKASIALLGKRASLESIAVLSQSQDNMEKLCKAIENDYPEIAETIRQEYSMDSSRDFHNDLGWYLCKFQRLTSVAQLRRTLGAGANALDFQHTIDTDTVTLIDLASPTIGTSAARVIGTLILMKLWNAILNRKARSLTHMVIVDEAALFQTNPMPRMLAESRKFGISMVLCHQHTGQLSDEIRDALEANSANFSAFRLSPKDAALASVRFDNENMRTYLARQDAFQAVTTLSADGQQTAPFTLEISPPKQQKDGEAIAAMIEARSRETLVEPYRKQRALTPAEIQGLLSHPEKIMKPKWLNEWTHRHSQMKHAV